MKKTYSFATVIALALILGGCSCTGPGPTSTQMATNFIKRQHVLATTKEKYPAKNPHAVALYTSEQKPLMPYRIIGVATVSKYNLLGMHRQEDTVHEMMRNLAASIGGDGIINVSNHGDSMQASVIAFQRILI